MSPAISPPQMAHPILRKVESRPLCPLSLAPSRRGREEPLRGERDEEEENSAGSRGRDEEGDPMLSRMDSSSDMVYADLAPMNTTKGTNTSARLHRRTKKNATLINMDGNPSIESDEDYTVNQKAGQPDVKKEKFSTSHCRHFCRWVGLSDSIRRPSMLTAYEYHHPTENKELRMKVEISKGNAPLKSTRASAPQQLSDIFSPTLWRSLVGDMCVDSLHSASTSVHPAPSPSTGLPDPYTCVHLLTRGGRNPRRKKTSFSVGKAKPRSSCHTACPLCCPSCTFAPRKVWKEVEEHYMTEHWQQRRYLGAYTIFPCGNCCTKVQPSVLRGDRNAVEKASAGFQIEPMPQHPEVESMRNGRKRSTPHITPSPHITPRKRRCSVDGIQRPDLTTTSDPEEDMWEGGGGKDVFMQTQRIESYDEERSTHPVGSGGSFSTVPSPSSYASAFGEIPYDEKYHFHCPVENCHFVTSDFDALRLHTQFIHPETAADCRCTPEDAATLHAPFVGDDFVLPLPSSSSDSSEAESSNPVFHQGKDKISSSLPHPFPLECLFADELTKEQKRTEENPFCYHRLSSSSVALSSTSSSISSPFIRHHSTRKKEDQCPNGTLIREEPSSVRRSILKSFSQPNPEGRLRRPDVVSPRSVGFATTLSLRTFDAELSRIEKLSSDLGETAADRLAAASPPLLSPPTTPPQLVLPGSPPLLSGREEEEAPSRLMKSLLAAMSSSPTEE